MAISTTQPPEGLHGLEPDDALETVDVLATRAHWKRRRPRLAWALSVVGVLAVVAAAVVVTRSRAFALREVRVDGAQRLSAAQVERIAGLSPRTNVVWFSTAAVRTRLERNVWVERANVARQLPGTIEITIVERRPVAIAEPGGWLIAGDGRVLGVARPGDHLPSIEPGVAIRPGWRLAPTRSQLSVARSLASSLARRVEAVKTHAGSLTLTLRGGGVVVLGTPTVLAIKEDVMLALLDWARSRGVRVARIDVSHPAVPALMPASAAT